MKYFGGRKTRRNEKGKKTGGNLFGNYADSMRDKFNAATNAATKFASQTASKFAAKGSEIGSEIGKNVSDRLRSTMNPEQLQRQVMDNASTAANITASNDSIVGKTIATGAEVPASKLGGRRRYRKGSRSKTRKGRKDFITHKGSKYYNRRGHRQTRNSKGRKGRPYRKRRTHKRGAGCGNYH